MQHDRIKIAKWDNFKFFLIATVVIGHFLAKVDDENTAKSIIFFIYSFHMPGFVFVSGLFSKRSIIEKRYDKIFSYLVLFLVTKFAVFFCRMIKGINVSFRLLDMNDVSWYAFAVFVFYLMTIFLQQYSRRYIMTAAIVFACMAGFAQDVGTFLSLSRIATFYPFFLLGFYWNPEDIIKLTDRWYVKLCAVFIILQMAVLSFTRIDSINWLLKICKGKYAYEDLACFSEWGALLRLAWYPMAMFLVLSWIAVMPSGHSVITTWGGRTMQVYALHYLPIALLFDRLNVAVHLQKFWPQHYLILIVLLACLVTCVLSCRPIQVLMNHVIYPKKVIADNS